MNRTRRLSDRWLARRRRLHEVFAEQVGFTGNASSLEEVGYRRRTFSEDELAALWAEAARTADHARSRNHVYVHVPFCKSICHFCAYKRFRPRDGRPMQIWLERLRTSLETVGPALEGFTFHSLYFGGGTPSLLPAPILEEALSLIDRHVPLVDDAARFFEADPAVLDARKLEVLRAHRIGHVSMGVQTLDAQVNADHDRGAQDEALIARRLAEIREAGIEGTSLDFLLGLHGTEPEPIFREIDRTLGAYRPRWVDVFFLTPTQAYVDLHFGGSHEAFWAHQHRFAGPAKQRLTAIARRHGYDLSGDEYDAFVLRRRGEAPVPGLAWVGRALDRLGDRVRARPGWLGGVPEALLRGFARQRDESVFSYTQYPAEQHRPLNLLGLGSGARTRIFGRVFAEYDDPGGDPDAEGPAVYRGIETDPAFEARSYLLIALRDHDRLDLDRAEAVFGLPVDEVLPETLGVWREEGLVREEGRALVLTHRSRTERARDLMWVLDDADLEDGLARQRDMDLSSEAVAGLVAPLTPGDRLAEAVVLDAVHAAAVTLRQGVDRVRVRLAPRLDRTTGVELVPEGRLPELGTALRRLQALLRRNGADDLGIRDVPEVERSAFTPSGQAEPAPVARDRRQRVAGARSVPAPVHDPAADPARPLTAAQRAAYDRDGVLVGLPLLTADEVVRYRTWLERLEAEQKARDGGRWENRTWRPGATRTWPLLAWIDELGRHPRILDAVEGVLGPDLMLRNVDVFVREPRARDGLVPHRDTPLDLEAASSQVNLWVALTGAIAENGAVRYWPGTHRVELPDPPLSELDLNLSRRHLRALPRETVDAAIGEGQGVLHHPRTVHASGGNRTRHRRIGVVLRYVSAAADPVAAECGQAVLVRGRVVHPAMQAVDHPAMQWSGS